MDKSKDELKELIRLLKKAIAKKSLYKANTGYRPTLRPRGLYTPKAVYSPKPNRHPARHDFTYKPEPSYKSKPEKPSYHSGKVWTEPTPYKLEKERIVYDPEVKELLKRIEKHLADSEPDAEEMLKQLEDNPELYEKISDKLMEKMNENYEALEKPSNEIIGYVFRDPSAGSSFRAESQEKLEGAETQPKATAESEVSEEEDFLRDMYLENEADVLREMEADEELSREEAMEPTEPEKLTEESPEVMEDASEASTIEVQPVQTEIAPEAVIEAIEAQDLSALESELFPEEFVEPLETEKQEEPNGY